jgi:hypothetical protein
MRKRVHSLNDTIHVRSNNSLNASGMGAAFIENLNQSEDASRRVNPGVRPPAIHAAEGKSDSWHSPGGCPGAVGRVDDPAVISKSL